LSPSKKTCESEGSQFGEAKNEDRSKPEEEKIEGRRADYRRRVKNHDRDKLNPIGGGRRRTDESNNIETMIKSGQREGMTIRRGYRGGEQGQGWKSATAWRAVVG